MHEEFLPNDSEVPFAEVPTQASTHPGYGNEYVKVMVVGSRKGIDLIIKRLCSVGFAEMSEWSPAVPYEVFRRNDEACEEKSCSEVIGDGGSDRSLWRVGGGALAKR